MPRDLRSSLTTVLLLLALPACETDLDCDAVGGTQEGNRCVLPDGGVATDGAAGDAADAKEGGPEAVDGGGPEGGPPDPEPDADDDGVADAEDNCPDANNAGQADLDGDELGDACDPDVDGDGRGNGADNCPEAGNPSQDDLDGDGLGDACDPDADEDGVLDAVDACPGGLPPSDDLDGDGCQDAEDPDVDGDGILDDEDPCPRAAERPLEEDGDGCPAAVDACPLGLSEGSDSDGDGCKDAEDPNPASADDAPPRLYVDAEASGAGTLGPQGWQDAFPNLASALSAADYLYADKGRRVQVLVAAGIYRPDQGGDFEEGDTNAHFGLNEGIDLWGGFRHDTEADLWVRDAMDRTTLSGDLGGDDDTRAVPAHTRIEGNNACNVITIVAAKDGPAIDGFVIEGADGCGGVRVDVGGGDTASTATLRSLEVRGNLGSGLRIGTEGDEASEVFVLGCDFRENHNTSGGGIHWSQSEFGPARLIIHGTRFVANSATQGGAAYLSRMAADIVNTEFLGNSASERASALQAMDCIVTVDHCSFGGHGPAELLHDFADSLHIRHSVLWNYRAGLVNDDSYAPSLDQCLNDWGGGGVDAPANVSMDWSPFVVPPDPSLAPTTAGALQLADDATTAFDLNPSPTCPAALDGVTVPGVGPLCADGELLYDLGGGPRVRGPKADLGAWEWEDQ